jgi:hypothetical protein
MIQRQIRHHKLSGGRSWLIFDADQVNNLAGHEISVVLGGRLFCHESNE